MSAAVRNDDTDTPFVPDLSPVPEPQPRPRDSGVVVTEEEITPEYAAYLLDNLNLNPRKLRRDKAAQYAADMASGNWHLGTGMLMFDKEGNLRDGQHRAAGCVMSGVSFVTLVARGVSDAAVDNADRGFKRSVADILKGKGEANVTILQAALNMCVRWDEAGVLSGMVPTWPQMEKYLLDNPDIREAVIKCAPLVKNPLGIRGSVAAPIAMRIRRIDAEAADGFIHQLHTGIGLAENDPILRLREHFLSRRVSAYGRPSREHDLAIFIKTWNAYVVGRSLRQLKWNRGGTRQEPFPYLVGPDGIPWPFPDFVRDQNRQNLSDLAEDDEDQENTDD